MTFARSLLPMCAWFLCRLRRVRPARGMMWKALRRSCVRNGDGNSAGRGCDHRLGHDPSRRGWLGRGCDYRRIAEGADDSSRPRVLRGKRAGVAADGDDDFSALLLRLAQGTQVGGQGRIRLHAARRRCLRRWERRWSLSGEWEMATWPRDAKRWSTMPNSAPR